MLLERLVHQRLGQIKVKREHASSPSSSLSHRSEAAAAMCGSVVNRSVVSKLKLVAAATLQSDWLPFSSRDMNR